MFCHSSTAVASPTYPLVGGELFPLFFTLNNLCLKLSIISSSRDKRALLAFLRVGSLTLHLQALLVNKKGNCNCVLLVSTIMAMKIKGIYKGFKCISQIFVVKEREIEIGYPTDVKHVAHIGWEGSSGSAPSWMSEFKAGAEVLSPRASSFGNARHSKSFFSAGSSNDFDQSSKQPIMSGMSRAIPSANLPSAMKKNRKKKSASSGSSPRSVSSSRSSRSFISKSTYKTATSR